MPEWSRQRVHTRKKKIYCKKLKIKGTSRDNFTVTIFSLIRVLMKFWCEVKNMMASVSVREIPIKTNTKGKLNRLGRGKWNSFFKLNKKMALDFPRQKNVHDKQKPVCVMTTTMRWWWNDVWRKRPKFTLDDTVSLAHTTFFWGMHVINLSQFPWTFCPANSAIWFFSYSNLTKLAFA